MVDSLLVIDISNHIKPIVDLKFKTSSGGGGGVVQPHRMWTSGPNTSNMKCNILTPLKMLDPFVQIHP